MQRRALLTSMAGGMVLVSGCTSAFTEPTSKEVYNPTGQAKMRPIDEPIIQHGITSESEQYLYARLFVPGDSLAVTDAPGALDFSKAIDELTENQFAILTNLRTAAAAPAYFWPAGTHLKDGQLRIEMERQPKSPLDTGVEAVGVALTFFDIDGEPPDGANIVFPSGATFAV